MTTVALERFRPHIEAALSYAGESHRYEDVAEMVSAGRAMFWPGPDSVIITETIEHPRSRVLHFFLAGGRLPELRAMTPLILDWGRSQGCTHASLLGRRGWQRSFLAHQGWTTSALVLMETTL